MESSVGLGAALAALALMVVSGCASDTHVASDAFDTLTSESVAESSFYTHYTGVLSINGFAPAQSLGMLFYQPSGVGASHAIGISPKWSFLTQTTLAMPGDPGAADRAFEQVVARYLDVQKQAEFLAADQVRVQRVEALLAAANALPAGNADKAAIVAAAATLLGKVCPENCTSENIEASLAELQQRIQAAFDAFENKKNDFQSFAGLNNIVVTRWTSNARREASASAGSRDGTNATAEGSMARQKKGVAIFGDLRILTMHFGEDFVDLLRDYGEKGGFWNRWFFSNIGVVSYVVQAKRARYFADADTQSGLDVGLSATLGSLEGLGKVADALKTLEKQPLQARYTEQLLSSAGNTGAIYRPKVERYPYCFFPGPLHQAYIEKNIADEDGYLTIYAVRVNVRMPLQYWLTGSKTDLQRILELREAPRCSKEACEEKVQREKTYKKLMKQWQARCKSGLTTVPPGAWDGLFPPLNGQPLKRLPDRREADASER